MAIVLELGKCYVRRDGEITGPLVLNDTFSEPRTRTYPFKDPKNRNTYAADGKRFATAITPKPEDLIGEYKIQPLLDLTQKTRGSTSVIWA